MSNTSTASASAPTVSKQDRLKFGVSGKPVVATRAFTKTMNHDSPQGNTKSWILVTPANTRIHVNTYNGNAGKGFDPSAGQSHPMPAADTKEYRQVIKGYEEVSVATCPIAVAAG